MMNERAFDLLYIYMSAILYYYTEMTDDVSIDMDTSSVISDGSVT